MTGTTEITPDQVLVLIPSYNEAKHIGEIVHKLSGQNVDVLVIDDGSTDNTKERAKESGAEVISYKENLGKGAALRKGFEHACSKQYDAVCIMDGDGQHDPDELPAFIKALAEPGSDIVIGTRMGNTTNMPFIRKMTNIVTSRIISFLAKNKLTDTQSGYRALRIDVVQSMDLKTDNYDIESEMIIIAARNGFNISEIPIRTIYGPKHKSSIRPFHDTVRFIKLVLRFIFHRKK